MTNTGAGAYNSLYGIGITSKEAGLTASYMDKGKLYINEQKLKDAIATNPDQVTQLLTSAGTTVDDPSTKMIREDLEATSNDVGIAERMYRALNQTVKRLGKLAGNSGDSADVSTIGLKMRDYDIRISEANSRLADYEQQYYSQFARLETMINKAQAQQAWLASSFSGGGQ
jgi:flagellar hook-associated protein 2